MFDNLKKIYRLVRPYGRRRLVVVFGTTLIQGIVQTIGVASIVPFLAVASDPDAAKNSELGKQLLNPLPELSDQTLILIAGLFAAGMLVFSNALYLGAVYLTTRYARGFGCWLRVQLLRQITYRDYEYFLQSSSGVLLKKVNGDAIVFVNQVLMPLFQIVSGGLNVMLLTVTLVFVNPAVAVFSGLCLSVAYVIVYRMLSTHRRLYSDVMLETSRGSNRLVHQLLSAIKPIKVHGVEGSFLAKFKSLAEVAARLQAKQTVYQVAPRNLVEPIALGIIVAVVVAYSYRGEGLAEILPMLGLMAMAAYRLLPNIQAIYASATTYQSCIYSLNEVYDELSPVYRKDSVHERRGGGRVLSLRRSLEIRDLVFRYPSSKANVIDGLNLKMKANTSLALVGTTGCGKSTLVDLILGLHRPSSGFIYVDGVALTDDNKRDWMTCIGYVPQDVVLIDDTIAANIALGEDLEKIDWNRLEQACETAKILQFIQDLEDGWNTSVGERGLRLSGGQRQRLGIARSLYRSPELIILDEATSALDVETELSVIEAIKDLAGKITMIIIAHRLTTVQWCDQTIDLATHKSVIASG